MKIVRANKQIARLKGEISDLKKRISSSLNTHSSNDFFKEKFEELMKSLNEKTLEMMFLKARVHFTNIKHEKFATIINLGELKSFVEFIRELEPKEGVVAERYEEKDVFRTQLSTKNKNFLINECQKMIDRFTDELDEYNSSTDLEDLQSDFYLSHPLTFNFVVNKCSSSHK